LSPEQTRPQGREGRWRARGCGERFENRLWIIWAGRNDLWDTKESKRRTMATTHGWPSYHCYM